MFGQLVLLTQISKSIKLHKFLFLHDQIISLFVQISQCIALMKSEPKIVNEMCSISFGNVKLHPESISFISIERKFSCIYQIHNLHCKSSGKNFGD
jgi:hypothetical protein